MTNDTPQSSSTRLVVVGVDGSPSSKEALRWGLRQAQLLGAELEVVMAWRLPPVAYGAGMSAGIESDLQRTTKEELDRLVREVAGEVPPVPVSARLVGGPPAAVLVGASKEADILVVGSRGRGAFAGMMLGSVSRHCVTHANCPVVVIRGADEAGEAGEAKGKDATTTGAPAA